MFDRANKTKRRKECPANWTGSELDPTVLYYKMECIRFLELLFFCLSGVNKAKQKERKEEDEKNGVPSVRPLDLSMASDYARHRSYFGCGGVRFVNSRSFIIRHLRNNPGNALSLANCLSSFFYISLWTERGDACK